MSFANLWTEEGLKPEVLLSEGAHSEWLGVACEPGLIIDVLPSSSCEKQELIMGRVNR